MHDPRPRPRVLAALCAGLLSALALVSCSGSGSDSSPLSAAQMRSVLDQHAAAVRRHDRAAFLAGVADTPKAATFRAAQQEQFANLSHVPLTRWAYTLAAPVRASGAQAAARARFGPSARIVKLTLHVAITGVDPVPAQHSLWWTLARVDGKVVICADDGLARQGGVSWQGPWDFGPVTTVRGEHSLVIGSAAQAADLRRIADVVDRAVPAVTAIWGTHWAQDVLVVVPTSSPALQAALGDTDFAGPSSGGTGSGGTAGQDGGGSGSPVSGDTTAVAVSDGQDALSGQAVGQRVVIEQRAFDGLSPIGRQIVFTHEITHVASAAATGGASPRWLVEGFAEYVANLHTGLAVRTAASELVTQVGRDGLPASLPGDDAFDSASAAAAYEQAWLACRLIASKAGPAGLVRFYRRVGVSGLSSQTAIDGALRSVLHETSARFTGEWRAYLESMVG